MTELTKPIPDHHFHGYSDELIQDLIVAFYKYIEKDREAEKICKELIDDAYKILGYRAAIEYIEKYENK